MIMDTGEIVREYNAAAKPQKQIGILAELNGCTTKEIAAILREAGCELPGNYGQRTQKGHSAEPLPQGTQTTPTEEKPDGNTAGYAHAEDKEYVRLADALPMLVRTAAVQTVAQLLKTSDGEPGNESTAIDFRERVRGVLALVYEIEQRCGGEEEE